MERLLDDLKSMLELALADAQGVTTSLQAEVIDRLSAWSIQVPHREMWLLALSGVAACLMFLLWRRRRRRSELRDASHELRDLTRSARMLGYAAALVFFGGFGAWAATALLASAVIAHGIVSPDGYRKTVQHLEGGIIQEIHVREGDSVVAGQPLVTMEALDAHGRYNELRERYVHYLTMESRLSAELAGASEIEFPEEVTLAGEEQVHRAVAGQQELLRSRLATRDGREHILLKRVKQIEEEISGLHKVIASKDTELALIEREIEGARQLYEKGLERLPRLLALERAQSDIHATQAANRAQIARNEQQIGETEMQILTMRQQDHEAVSEELTKVRNILAELRSQLPWREDVLRRTAIVAPISGTVVNLRVTTASGVITSGQPILDIVPDEPNLIIDARLKPIDIDMVRPAMMTRIVLSAYPQRYLPQIHGILRSVSADRLTDERTGEGYFLAKVEVDPVELARLQGVRLLPGMPAEVMILTGEHTLLDYLLAPLRDSLLKSFRES